MKDYEQIYNDFWKEIIENKDGSINIDQLKRELHDFHTAITNVGKVYYHITGGRISKINTLAEVVISKAEEYYEELYKPENLGN